MEMDQEIIPPLYNRLKELSPTSALGKLAEGAHHVIREEYMHQLFTKIKGIGMVSVGQVETGIIKTGMVVTFVLFSCHLK